MKARHLVASIDTAPRIQCSTLLLTTILVLALAVPPLHAQEPFHAAAAPPPRPGTIFLYPERVPLEDGRLVEADRGLLFVPMTRRDTTRGVVSVEIWRFRAREPSGRPPVFRLPGGPGFEGLEEDIDADYYDLVVQPYTQVQDYVVMGQRGIGASKPNTLCAIGGPGGVAGFSRRCRAYWESKGLDRTGFTVIEAAADVADAARALGYERIVIRGGSFGSHWAMAVMRYHPEIVAWALLSGTEGPNHTYDSPTGLLNALRRVAAAAEQSADLEHLIPEGGLIHALEAVRSRLAESPISVSVSDPRTDEERTVRFTEEDVTGWSGGYTNYVGSRQGVTTWPADVLRLYYGDFGAAARVRLRNEARAAASEGSQDYPTASQDLLDCSSGITTERLAELRADPAQSLVWAEYTWYEEICAPWEVDVGDEFRRNFTTDIPTAIVHGTWDFSTPLENALELAPYFQRGKLVTVVGGSHGALGEAIRADSAFADAFWTFMRTGEVSVLPDSVVLPPIDWVVPEDLEEIAATRERDRP